MASEINAEPTFVDDRSDAALLARCLDTGALQPADRMLDNNEKAHIVEFIKEAGVSTVKRFIPHVNFQSSLNRTNAISGFATLLDNEAPIVCTSDLFRQRALYEVKHPKRNVAQLLGFDLQNSMGEPVKMDRDQIVRLLPGECLPEKFSKTQADFVARVVNEEFKFSSQQVETITEKEDTAFFTAALEGDGFVFPLCHLDTYTGKHHYYIGVETGVAPYVSAVKETFNEKGSTMGQFVNSGAFKQLNTLSNANADAIAARVAKQLGVELEIHTDYSSNNCVLNMKKETYATAAMRSYLSSARPVQQSTSYAQDGVVLLENAGSTICPYTRMGFIYTLGMPREIKIMHPRTQQEQEGKTLDSCVHIESEWKNEFLNSIPASEEQTHNIADSKLATDDRERERYQDKVAWDSNMADVNLNLLFPHTRAQNNNYNLFDTMGFKGKWYVVQAMAAFFRVGQTDMSRVNLELAMQTTAKSINNYYYNIGFSDKLYEELESADPTQLDSLENIIDSKLMERVPDWRMIPVKSDVTSLITKHWPRLQEMLKATSQERVQLCDMFVEITPKYLKMSTEVLSCLDDIVSKTELSKTSAKPSVSQKARQQFQYLMECNQQKTPVC